MGFDAHDFVAELRYMEITPHIAQNDTKRRSAVDQRTTRHAGYQLSQKKRKRIEEAFGWMKVSDYSVSCDIEGWRGSVGCLPLRRQLTTWCESAT